MIEMSVVVSTKGESRFTDISVITRYCNELNIVCFVMKCHLLVVNRDVLIAGSKRTVNFLDFLLKSISYHLLRETQPWWTLVTAGPDARLKIFNRFLLESVTGI